MWPDTLRWRHFYVGVDLGQQRDYTAIAVVDKSAWYVGEPNRVDFERQSVVRYDVRHLERVPLGTPYPVIAERMRYVVRSGELAGQCTLVIDATGVGKPVVDMVRRQPLGCTTYAAIITGGDQESTDGSTYRIPRRDLLMGLSLMFQEDRLRIARDLKESRTLVSELARIRARISTSGRESFDAWREADHDDLVLAVALACWRAEK